MPLFESRKTDLSPVLDWRAIYEAHSDAVYRFLWGMTRHREEAEDLLQETFIKAMNAKSSVRDEAKIKSWLLAIARNLCLDNLKKMRSRGKITVKAEADTMLEVAADDNPTPEKAALNSDFSSRLEKVLAGMQEAYRTAFNLGIVLKLPYQEIADITGWSKAMVKTNIFRARKMAAEALQEFR